MEYQVGQKVRITTQTTTYSIMGRTKTVANARFNQVGTIVAINNGSVRVEFADPKPEECHWEKFSAIELA